MEREKNDGRKNKCKGERFQRGVSYTVKFRCLMAVFTSGDLNTSVRVQLDLQRSYIRLLRFVGHGSGRKEINV